MKYSVLLAATGLLIATPVAAEVKSQSQIGFVSSHSAEVAAKPDDVWRRLIIPKDWWTPEHSWFGKADGFYIDAQAGGCFCETAPEKTANGQIKAGGSVEHMRVIFADPGKVLRMQGALGPLQSEAVVGTLTVAIEPLKQGDGSKLSFNYTVGGYSRFPMDKMAGAVDQVIASQFASFIKPLGAVVVSGDTKASNTKASDTRASDATPDDWSIDPAKLEEETPRTAAPSATPQTAKSAKVVPDSKKPASEGPASDGGER
jgi:hypothetical protein